MTSPSQFLGFDALKNPIRLTRAERKAHMHVIGSSGSGKSKFLEWMMRRDLDNRQGFCLIDPHGMLYDEVLQYAAHHCLEQDIVPLNLSDPKAIIPFTPFRRTEGGDVSVQVDEKTALTLAAWNARHSDETPTLERTLSLIFTAAIEENLSLPDLRHFINFESKEIRAHFIERLESPLVQDELVQLQLLRRQEWHAEVLSTRNRLFRLLRSTTLSRFMGLPDRSINLREIMDKGKVLLVKANPSKTLSRANARVATALMLHQFFTEAQERTKDEFGNDPEPYYLYVDEFQNLITNDIGDILDQSRKRGLFTILAHQRFGQIDQDIAEAVLTNCHIKAVFGGLPVPSARLMAEEFFIGEIDPKRVKVAIYQTKFWPEYRRDTVYTHGTSSGKSHSSGSQFQSGESSSFGSSQCFGPNEWFLGGQYGSSDQWGTSSGSGSSDSDSDSSGESESEADIPIFVPVPFQELSSLQHYTPEEQLLEFTAALKNQFPRHCFIKIHQQDAQPMLVPFVEQLYVSPANKVWYEEVLLKRENALSIEEVDRLLAEREENLLAEIEAESALPEDFRE